MEGAQAVIVREGKRDIRREGERERRAEKMGPWTEMGRPREMERG